MAAPLKTKIKNSRSQQFFRRRSQGQSVVEYTVGLLVVFWILFDANFWGGRTAVQVLMDAFQNNYHGYEYAQSQPVLD